MAKKESFFKGVKSEMEKTSWPTKEELFKYTVIVVSTVIFFLVFIIYCIVTFDCTVLSCQIIFQVLN